MRTDRQKEGWKNGASSFIRRPTGIGMRLQESQKNMHQNGDQGDNILASCVVTVRPWC
jgi:hypothetical protein